MGLGKSNERSFSAVTLSVLKCVTGRVAGNVTYIKTPRYNLMT